MTSPVNSHSQLISSKCQSENKNTENDNSDYTSNYRIPSLTLNSNEGKKCSLSSENGDDDINCLFNQSRSSFFGFTKRQWLTLCNFALANFFSSIVISLQGPFYPREAEAKGASATEYGFVFGIFELTMFIMCPICGALMERITPRLMFNAGIFSTGVFVILFGLLHYVDDRLTFISMSFVIRIAQACGDSAFVTASFTLISMEFPDSVATTFSALETCFGLGLIVGPTVGGILYQVGGFFVTFLVVGCCILLIAFLTYYILPKSESSSDSSPEAETTQSSCKGISGKDSEANLETETRTGLLSLITIPSVALASFSVVISCSSIGFLAATLEPHLRQSFDLSPLHTGLVFIIDGGMYALFAPMWGKLCDQTENLRIFTLFGALLTFAGFLFIGPSSLLPLDPTLWVTCAGLVLHGLGFGATLVSAFILALRDAVAHGFDDNVNTYGLCSGLWTSCFSLGCFIGPSIGGVLLDNYGFRTGSIYVLATQVIVVIVTMLFNFFSNKSQTQKVDETEKQARKGYIKSTDLLKSKSKSQNEKAPLLFSTIKVKLRLDDEFEKKSNSNSNARKGDYGAI